MFAIGLRDKGCARRLHKSHEHIMTTTPRPSIVSEEAKPLAPLTPLARKAEPVSVSAAPEPHAVRDDVTPKLSVAVSPTDRFINRDLSCLARSAELRVGKECVSTCNYLCTSYH